MTMRMTDDRYEIGTPENPEIIEPGQPIPPRREKAAPAAGRFARALKIVSYMISATAPALLVDSICFWLFDAARNGGGVLTWLFFFFSLPPAMLLTLVATVANVILLFAFFAALSGRPPVGMPRAFSVRFKGL